MSTGPILTPFQLRHEVEHDQRALAELIFAAGERAGFDAGKRASDSTIGLAFVVGFAGGVVLILSLAGFFAKVAA